MKITHPFSAALIAGLLILPLAAQALETSLSFEGNLTTLPPCTLKDGEQLEVDFGKNISIRKIDGSHFRTDLNYQVSCEETANEELALTLSLMGEPMLFNGDALQSSQQGLGIKIYQNNKVFKPGETIVITPDSQPRLEAVPVKDPDAKLTEGTFEAWATLSAQYQ